MFVFPTRGRSPPATAVPPSPPAPVGVATPLLEHLAGEFAPRVAGLWPSPHADFVTAPAERRHLVCLALASARGVSLGVRHDALLDLSLKQAVARAVPDAPDGLRRALPRLGERAWAGEDYLRLLYLLRLGTTGAKEIRHAEVLKVEQVRALAVLPTALLTARVGGFGLSADQARILAEAFALVAARDGHEAAGAIAFRWSGARDAEGLFDMVSDDVLPPLPAPPFPETARLRPLVTKPAIREAAARYRNCLRSRIVAVADGDVAIYEWVGGSPVVIEIGRDAIYGWRLVEAKGPRNAAVPEARRGPIVEELRRIGVHVGRGAWDLRNELERARAPGYVYEGPEADVQWLFD